MAKGKSPLDRLTSLGEEVLGKAQQNPAASPSGRDAIEGSRR
jgi:hypothetical protein